MFVLKGLLFFNNGCWLIIFWSDSMILVKIIEQSFIHHVLIPYEFTIFDKQHMVCKKTGNLELSKKLETPKKSALRRSAERDDQSQLKFDIWHKHCLSLEGNYIFLLHIVFSNSGTFLGTFFWITGYFQHALKSWLSIVTLVQIVSMMYGAVV